MMDLQEARACLDEHRIALAATSGMLKPDVAEDEAGQAIGKFNDRLIETLNSQLQDAIVLSILVCEEMKETPEQLVDFPRELADFFVALNKLRLAINKAAEERAEYLRQAGAASKEKERGVRLSETIREFKRSIGWMSDEAEENIDMWAKKAELILNTPDRIETCAAAETDAPGNEAGMEIRIEPLESASPSAENPGEECGTRANCTDDTEDLLNWVAGIDRASVIAVLSIEAEAAQLSVRSARQRSASQPAKLREAIDHVDRVNRILSFFRDGNIAPGMSKREHSLCQSFEEKMPVRGPS